MQTPYRAPVPPRTGREMRARQKGETATLPLRSSISWLWARSSWRDFLRHLNAVMETHFESRSIDRGQTDPARRTRRLRGAFAMRFVGERAQRQLVRAVF